MEVGITQATPEMVLAADVLDQKGRVLSRKGTTLNQDTIDRLKRWGISSLEIVGEEEEKIVVSEEHIQAAREYLQPFFEFINMRFPANKAIFRIYLDNIAIKIAEGWTPTDIDSDYDLTSLREDLFFRDEGSLENLIGHEVQMTSFSSIYFRIKQVLDSPLSSAKELADVISKDTTLTAKLLRLVNSPFYGFTNKIDSISRAVSIIGTNELSTLALGISAIKTFENIPGDLADMKHFWFHSIACGILASLLSTACSLKKEETCFVGGMLHEIGRLVMFKNLPQASLDTILFSRSNRIPIYEAERTVFGYDHAMIGSLLLKEWALPAELADGIRFQYSPGLSSSPELPAVLNLAIPMAMAIGHSPAGVVIMPALSEEGWAMLKLKPADLKDIAETAKKRVQEIADIFLPRKKV